jgi:hypothetical protein
MKARASKRKRLYLLIPFIVGIAIISLNYISANYAPQKALLSIQKAAENQIPNTDYYDIYFRSTPIATVDNYSECVELGHVLSNSKLSFASRPGSASTTESPCTNFSKDISKQDAQIFYGRFFHGTAALLRISLGLHEYKSIQILSSIIIFVLLLLLVLITAKKSAIDASILGLILFGLTDFPFQGKSLTHGVSTSFGLIMVLTLYIVRNESRTIIFATSLVGGLGYCYFAQLYTPIAFALLSVVTITSSRNREQAPVGNLVFTSWVIGYFGGIGIRFIQGVLTIGLKSMLNEDGGGLLNRVTTSITGLVRVTYMHLILNPSKYPLKVFTYLLLSFIVGIVTSRVRNQPSVLKWNMPIFPIAFTCVWYLSLGGHDGHGWVANLLFILIGYVILALNPKDKVANFKHYSQENAPSPGSPTVQ